MPVGKGSIQRAAKAKAAAEKKEEVVEMAVETKAAKEDMEKMEEAKTNTEKKEAAKAASEKKEAVKVPEKKKAAAPAKKETAKAAPKKKAVSGRKAASNAAEKKGETVIAASVISSDDIHEKKFEAVSRIYCELPTYLL